MKIKTDQIFKGISQELIDNAKIELEVDRIIEAEGFIHESTGKTDNNETYEFFKANYREDLTVYKLKKHSGYDLIVLYKNVAMVGIGDFMTTDGKEMESSFKIVDNWFGNQALKLKRKVLNNLFKDPDDNRKNLGYKPSVEKVWGMIEKCIIA